MKQFDVIELNNKSKAIIKAVQGKEYFVELLNTKEERKITDKEVNKIVYSKGR